MLKLVKAIQIAWSFLLLLIFGVASMRGFITEDGVAYTHLFLFLVSMVYIGAAFQCQYNNRVAWWMAIPVPALFLLMYLPMVLHNFALFFAGDALYLDSPATIFVVVIDALVFVMPALIIYYGLLLERKAIAGILFKKGVSEPVEKVERLFTLDGVKRLQRAWAVVLLLYYGLFFVRMFHPMEIQPYYVFMFLFAAAYFTAAVKCFRNSPIAWAAALVLPLLPMTSHVYVFCTYAIQAQRTEAADIVFLTQYYRSITNILFFVLPLLFLYYYLFHERKELAAILFRHEKVL